MNKSVSINEIRKAMANIQEEVKQTIRDANNPLFKSKYIRQENVVEAIHDIEPNHGLTLVKLLFTNKARGVGVKTLLMHESGEWIEFPPVFFEAEKQTPQGYGALITYIKRYSLSAIFGITSDQDDDGNESSQNEALATEKQRGYIKRLINEKQTKEHTFAVLHEGLKKRLKTNKNIDEWTSSQASQAIKILKGDSK